MHKFIQTTVLDAGGRYGLHPTWKPFTGELKYYLFEPDSVEAGRLKKKYARRLSEIKITDCALLDKEGNTQIFFFRNRAMSSCYQRNPISPLYFGERKRQVDIVACKNVKTITVDSFCEKNKVTLDFMKLDTEGSEYLILQGAIAQLSANVLGVRCEISFDRIFADTHSFSKIHDFLLEMDFYLLNLSYDGKGDYCNDFVEANGKYGILTACDGVWLKKYECLFKKNGSQGGRELAVRALKYAAFCMNNDANDVALDVLLQARRKYKLNFHQLSKTRLYQHVDIYVHKLFYRLKWYPGQLLRKHQKIYSEIFDKPMKEMHKYNESLILNPD